MKSIFFKIIAFLIFLSANFSGIFGQVQISGSISDKNQQPLPGASVLLLNNTDSTLVKGQISENDGSFRLTEIPAGSYFLRVTMLGYEDYLSAAMNITSADANKTLPAVVLTEFSTQIAEVQVVAKKPFFEQKIDRMVINVANSSVNAGSNALQVLQRSPGVLVNKQSNMISMSGKNGVLIMINGKINRMPPDAVISMLEGMSADNIERIELIHTPPASFDAEGNAGIINIVLKQSAEAGLNGNYFINAGYGKREKYGAGMSFNYRQKKINFFGNYSYQFDHNPQVFTNYRGIYRDGDFIETDGYSDRSPDLDIQDARAGVDFQVTPKTVVGVVGTYFDRYWDMDAVNDISYKTNGVTDSSIVMTTKEINRWNSYTGNLNFSHQFKPSQTLSFDADYIYYQIHNPSDYDILTSYENGNSSSEAKLRVSKENPIQIGVAKADYAQHFGKNIDFETGIKGSRSLFDNDVRVENLVQNDWISDASLTSRFKLTEDVLAAYSTVSFKINDKTDMKLGLRYEYTNTNLGSAEEPDIVDRQYGSWFPSVFISRKFSETKSLNLSFSRRIARPGFTQLAPYLIFYDPSTVQNGNPYLQPAFINAARADFRIKTVSLTVEYNYESPSIRDLPFVDVERNYQILRPENNGVTQTAYAMVNFPWQPFKWWDMQNTAFVATQFFDINYENQPLKLSSRFVGLNSTQSFTLPKKFSIEVSGGFITDNQYGVTKYKGNGQLSLGIQKELGPRWGKLNFSISDIFASNNWYGITDQPELNVLVKNSYQQAERVFKLTWTNKFGNAQLKEARQREGGASEERRRL